MKRFLSPILAAALAVGVASFAFAADLSSWTGTLTDSKCGEKGAKWAIYSPTTKETYVLSGKEDPSKFAGKEVTVKGTLNKDTKTIECTSIEAKK